MKSKIISLKRKEQDLRIIFEMDEQIVRNVEKTFQKLKPGFKLSNYKKKYGGKILDNFWELNKGKEDSCFPKKNFGFTFLVRAGFFKLKISGNLDFIDDFLRISEKYTEFSEISPRIKAQLERRKIEF